MQLGDTKIRVDTIAQYFVGPDAPPLDVKISAGLYTCKRCSSSPASVARLRRRFHACRKSPPPPPPPAGSLPSTPQHFKIVGCTLTTPPPPPPEKHMPWCVGHATFDSKAACFTISATALKKFYVGDAAISKIVLLKPSFGSLW